MDFSSITSITIPEGNVKKITDASGRVLWQKQEEQLFQLSGSLGDIWVYDSNYIDKSLSEIAESSPLLGIAEGDSIHIRLDNVTVLKPGTYQRNGFACTFEHCFDGTTTVTECSTLEVNGEVIGATLALFAGQKVSLDMTFPNVFTEEDEMDTAPYSFEPVIKYNRSTIIDFSKYAAIEYVGCAQGVFDNGWIE